MTTEEAIKILKEYNEWRRGAEIPMPDQKLIGEAIDTAISALEWRPVSNRMPKKEILQVRNDSCNPKFSHAIWDGRKWINPYMNCECKPTPTHYRPINF